MPAGSGGYGLVRFQPGAGYFWSAGASASWGGGAGGGGGAAATGHAPPGGLLGGQGLGGNFFRGAVLARR